MMELALRKSLEMNPYNRETLNALAQIYVQSGRPDEAFNLYKEAFETIEPDAAALVNFGMLAAERNDTATALKAFEDAIGRNPGYAPAHLHLAGIAEAEGNIPAALSGYERCEDMAKNARNSELENMCHLKVLELQKRPR